MDNLKKWIRRILLAIAGAWIAYVAFKISRRLSSRTGTVEISDAVEWRTVPGRDDMIMVADGPEHYAHVELPKGIKPDEVKAVAIKEHSAVVEVLHNATNRRSRSSRSDTGLD